MATFTIELRDVIEHIYSGLLDADEWEQPYGSFTFDGVVYGKLPTLSDYTPLGLGTYPIFDEGYRAILNGKIIDEYFTREIGTETIDNWLLIIRRKMDQIMPYFNKLYLTEQIDYKALDTMSIHSVGKNKLTGIDRNTGDTTTETETDSLSRAVASSTPQTMLSGNADYATSATDTNSQSEAKAINTLNTTQTSQNDADTDNLVTGYQAAASDLIVKYRASLINIDTMILTEIEDCFMLILNNGDSYTEHQYPYYYGAY